MWMAILGAVGQVAGSQAQAASLEAQAEMFKLEAQQEQLNAKAEAAGRLNQLNEALALQDVIFGTQGRKQEGSYQAIQKADELKAKRDISLIESVGKSRAAAIRAQAEGSKMAAGTTRSAGYLNALVGAYGRSSGQVQ